MNLEVLYIEVKVNDSLVKHYRVLSLQVPCGVVHFHYYHCLTLQIGQCAAPLGCSLDRLAEGCKGRQAGICYA